jgi:YVTN family beta-propeller protein
MKFRLLGPPEVASDGRRVTLGGAKQQAVLVYLLLHRNEIVSTERLVGELWPDEDPRRAAKALQMHVLGLRKVLEPERLETHGRGYRLRVDPGELDVDRAEALAKEAAAGDAAHAADVLQEALTLFRGDPLGVVAYESFATAEATRLRELRLHLLEERLEADLALGRHASLVPELESQVVEHPLRERLRGQLMVALYRSGRQADALAAYREGRRILVEVGLEPGEELRDLEGRILRQDPTLGPARTPPPPTRTGRPRRRVAAAVLGTVAVAALAGVVTVLALPSSSRPPVVVADSLVHIDAASDRIVAVVPTGRDPLAVLVSPDYLWVLNALDATVSRIARANGESRTVGGLEAPKSIALGPPDTLWVGSESTSFVVGLDVDTLRLTARIAVPGPPPAFVAVDGTTLWASQPNVGDQPGTVSAVDLDRGRVVQRHVLGGYTVEVAAADGAAWVAVGERDVLAWIRLDPVSVSRTAVGRVPSGAALGFDSAWTASYADGKVWRVNVVTRRVESVIPVGDGPWSIAVGPDAVWVTNRRAGTVSRIDPRTNAVVETIAVGFHPQGIAVDGDDVFVTVSSADVGI